MASLRRTPAGSYIVCFRFDGQQYQRSLKTKNPAKAKAALGRVEHATYKVSTGEMSVPANVDPVDYIVWGDAAVAKAEKAAETEANGQAKSFSETVKLYLDSQQGLKAESTLRTERTHLNNLTAFLGDDAKLRIDQVTEAMLDAFLQHREQQTKPVTVIKERQTVKSMFDWATRKLPLLHASPATELRRPQAGVDRHEFRTLVEIQETVGRGGLTDEEEMEYWESLYLTEKEVGEVLASVQACKAHDFIYPMFALAAYTGMRRGEIVSRLRWSDVNFTHKVVTARSKKQSRQDRETSRKIALHTDLETILLAYQAKRPKGQYVICFEDTLKPLTVYQAHDHFRRALKKTQWERTLPSGQKRIVIGFHTFRHSFASNLALRGVDQRIIDEWMGHQTEAMRKRYRHLFPNKLAEEIRKLSFQQDEVA